jgi:hypothetical protein
MMRFLEHWEDNISLKKNTIIEITDILNYTIDVFMVLNIYPFLLYEY